MNHGNGIKDREDGSSGIEILIAEAFAKSSPTRKSEFFDVTHGWTQGVCELFVFLPTALYAL
jgi:hypothetical protein